MKNNKRPAESGQINENKYTVDAPLKLEEYRQQLVDKKLDKNLEVFDHTVKFLKDIKEAGGVGHIVGGAARDLVMGKVSKDYDVEVYQLTSEKIEKIASQFGKVQNAGQAFGVLKIMFRGMDIDVSLPRTDSKIAAGHRGFHVKTDPFMSFKDAARRRDLTMNSMGWDPLENKIIDPFDGMKDIQAGIVRVTDHERFGDDPLRVYRVCQFVSRFDMKVHYGDIPLLKSMLPYLPELSEERIWEEWSKMILKSKQPSLGLQTARELGILEKMHPPLQALNPSQWEQAKQIVDRMAEEIDKDCSKDDKISYILAGLVHQLDQTQNKQLLQSIKASKRLTAKVLKLTEHYQSPEKLFQQSVGSLAPLRKLLGEIFPAKPEELEFVGRIIYQVQSGIKQYPAGPWFLNNTSRFTFRSNGSVAGVTTGEFWLKQDYPQGPIIGQLIKLSNRLHDEKGFDKQKLSSLINHNQGYLPAEKALAKMKYALQN